MPQLTRVIPGESDPVTVTALRRNGRIDTVFRGTIHFTSSDPLASLPPDYTFTLADAGVHVFPASLFTIGDQTISTTDAEKPNVSGISPIILVVAPTSTPTATPTITPTPSPTFTPTPNQTAMAAETATAQAFATSTSIAAKTSTSIATATSQANSTSTSIAAQTATAQATPTATCNPCILTTDQNATQVVGQSDFNSSSTSPVNASSLNHPSGVIWAGNKLIVTDSNNSRILIYSPAPSGNQPAAVKVVGQADFTANAQNQGGVVNNNTLSIPWSVWSDGTLLIVSDLGNNRVLIYNNINVIPNANGVADIVIGQIDMTHGQTNQGGSIGANTLFFPTGVFYDGQRLFIADDDNNRVLIYNSLPTTNNAAADEVIGQPNFISNSANQGGGPTAQTLDNPIGLCVYNGSLFVSDSINNRVLGYNNAGLGIDSLSPGSTNLSADTVVGQNNFTSNASGTTGNTLNDPYAVSANNCQLYIADFLNNRVLVYNSIPTGTMNPNANIVLGQPDMISGSSSGSPQGNNFNNPFALQAINGFVYVADSFFNRILAFSCQAGTGSNARPVQGLALSMKLAGREPASTFTPAPTLTITPTFTLSSTPTIGILAVVAAPNISRNGQPVHFQIVLPKFAQIRLALFTLLGEQIYQTTFQGNAGLNNFDWNTQNQMNQLVASGLYIYILETDDITNGVNRKTGKVVILH